MSADDLATLRRQLKIKTGAASRLNKEHGMYQKEAADLKIKKDKLRADGAEEWDIKNAGKMEDESYKMIQDTADRLAKAYGELRDLVVSAKKQPGITDDEVFHKAEEILEEAAL
ncbi:tubulin binding cofactor A [Roridomyces roridus]|uniref:Tubulin-specific chaperone A n=1 Tax=Roridomyces roridus TaxID=1738132 RepID=A0AAD7AWN4_9AGAR|nr:tubulin binding cofactor A [Roridomyces roridus]